MIAAGSILTVTIAGRTGVSQSSSDIVAAASGLLYNNDSIQILSYNIQKSSLLDQITQLYHIPYTATMKVKVQADYGQADDVLSIVKGEFYAATGNNEYPTAGSVLDVTDPSGNVFGTGEPGQVAPTAGAGTSVGDVVGNFFSGLQTDTTILLIVVIGIVVLVLVLAAYGPNVGAISKAAAMA